MINILILIILATIIALLAIRLFAELVTALITFDFSSEYKNMKLFILKYLHSYWSDYVSIKYFDLENYKQFKSLKKEKARVDKIKKEKINKSFMRFIEYIRIITSASNKEEFNFIFKNENTQFRVLIFNYAEASHIIFSRHHDKDIYHEIQRFKLNEYKNASDTVKELVYLSEEEVIEFLKGEYLETVKNMKEEIDKNKESFENSSNDEYYISAEKEVEEFLKQNNIQ